MSETPHFDDLERGDVVLAPDPFRTADDATRPWVVANRPTHPFHGEQYVTFALTSRTWFDERVALTADDYVHRRAPADSSIVPHAPASIQPRLMADYVCRLRPEPVDQAVEMLFDYL